MATILEALATRNDETPRLKLTVVLTASIVQSAMKEVGQRMEMFARLMGVPFEFKVVRGSSNLEELTKEGLGIQDDEAVAINCVGTLRRVDIEQRELILRTFRLFWPRVVTVVEEEADFSSTREDFVRCFEECLKFYSAYFEMLEKSFLPTSNERLMPEREYSQSIVRVLACGGGNGGECERGVQWSEKLGKGFSPIKFSEEAVDNVRALLKTYQTGWSLVVGADTLGPGWYLAWKDEPVVWASAWKP